MVLLWTKLNPIHPWMPCAKFGWNWLSGSGEVFLSNFVNVFSLFGYHFPLEKPLALHWTRLNFLYHRMLCAKFGVLEKKIKIWKLHRQTDGQAIRKAHLSFQLRWAEKKFKPVAPFRGTAVKNESTILFLWIEFESILFITFCIRNRS